MNQSPSTLRERLNISRLAIAAPWLTIGLWLAVAVAGMMAFSSLKYALFPDISFPVVVVSTPAPLSQAVDIEQKITRPIEQALQALPKLQGIRSSSYPNQSAVSLSFQVGSDLENASSQVKAAIASLKLPAATPSQVIALNLNESAAISYAIEGSPQAPSDLIKLTQEQIMPAIAQLPGVLKVNLLGDADLKTLPLSPSATAPKSLGTLVRLNGRNVLALQVIKRADANALDVVNAVEQQMAQLRQRYQNLQFTQAATQAPYIRQATHSTIMALLEAIGLSVMVIFPFLRSWPATLISALAIPLSLLGTFIVMASFGFNLETITLLALALVIGSVVDDAIVDVENISRHLETGKPPRQAALQATNEIGLTVTAATLTVVAVFLPIGLMNGVIGQFFKPFGITVSAAMITSLLVARTLSPVLAIYWLRSPAAQADRGSEPVGQFFVNGYQRLLAWSLHHRKWVVGLALLSFVAGLAVIPFIPQGFIPKLDRGEFHLRYTTPLPQLPDPATIAANPAALTNLPPHPLQTSRTVAEQLEAAVRQSAEVETVFTTIGSRDGTPNQGLLAIKLNPNHPTPTDQFQEQLRSRLPQIPGVTTSVEEIPFVEAGQQNPLQVVLQGEDIAALSKTATALKQRLDPIPGFVDVTITGSTLTQNRITQIDRHDDRRVVYVSANLGKALSLGAATDRMTKEAQALLPAGISLDLGGDSATSREIFQSFGTTLGLSALCIVAVLVLLFRSWIDPIVVGLSLPLAIVGAMLALLFTRSDFGMISLIGAVFLLGLTNKNAILIVDYINQLRRQGLERSEAILKAGPIRLRPILMTTAATILGMLPLALGWGAGAELRTPMAIAIAGGLITSTLLSLVVVPVVYALLDDLKPSITKSSGTN